MPLRFFIPVVFAALLPAVQAQQQPLPTLSLSARLVVLDVTASDAAGHPVLDLSAKDFEVLEDGRPQRIRSVEPPSAHELPAGTLAAGDHAVFDPAHPAAFGRAPVTVLVLDQLNTHFADSSFARRSLLDYLNHQSATLPEPTTLLTLYDGHFRTLAPFTLDREAILTALKAAPTEYAWKLEQFKNADHGPIERLDQSLQALVEIAQADAAIRGRKNLIWVGGGFPTLDPTTIDGNEAAEVSAALHHVTDVLQDTRVTLYAVDPTSSAAGMTEITDPVQAEFAEAAADGLALNADPFSSTDSFDRLGPVTGGRVVRGMNDVARQIGAAVALGSDYYTLSYTPDTPSDAAAGFRHIEVRCLRPGLHLTTREGYYPAETTAKDSAEAASYDLSAAAESPTPLNAIPVTATPDPAAPGTWLVRAGASALTWRLQPDGSLAASVYVLEASLDKKGKLLAHTLRGMTAHARPGTDVHSPGAAASFALPATPSPKAAALRFIVRDSATGRMGSVDLPAPPSAGPS